MRIFKNKWFAKFAKKERISDNITQEDEQVFKDLSQQLFEFSDDDIERMLESGVLVEVPYNDK